MESADLQNKYAFAAIAGAKPGITSKGIDLSGFDAGGYSSMSEPVDRPTTLARLRRTPVGGRVCRTGAAARWPELFRRAEHGLRLASGRG